MLCAKMDWRSSIDLKLRETKGSLLLRSDHMKYSRCTLNTNWHADREAEPKDYDICGFDEVKDRNLHRTTYNHVGGITQGSYKDIQSTQHESMDEVHRLKEVFEDRDIHKAMLGPDNFAASSSSMAMREAQLGKPLQGYGSILPRHTTAHGKMSHDTTHRINYQYPFQWTPHTPPPEDMSQPQFPRGISELTDNDGYKRIGVNTFRDCYGDAAETLT